MPARRDRDGTLQFELTDLTPGQNYEVQVEARPAPGQPVSAQVRGHFRTAPASDDSADVSFTLVTCHDFIRRDDRANGHKIYPAMTALEPHFTVHAGDVVYYDKPEPYAKSAELARFKWNRLFSLPFQKDYYANHAVYFQKDDHDIVANDAWPGATYGDLTWDQGLVIFHEQTPTGFRPYRTVRWGQHLQIWLMEGREYRSPNDMPDGPDKTIWGAEQKAWFFETFAASDATFRVLVSPMPVVGPDRPKKNDNHANEGFFHEGREIRDFLAAQENAFVINGDRHWQYASVDAERGIREYGSGPGSDSHAGGWSMDRRTPEQKFLRIAGGFLRVAIEVTPRGPLARVQHFSVEGEVVNEDVWPAFAGSAQARSEPADSGDWELLFDGGEAQAAKFHLYNQPDVFPERWRVVGDVLTLAGRKESPGLREKEDIVITPRPYQDFELEWDWKMSVGANGGIFYKVVQDPKYDKPWHTGLEYQLLDNDNHKEGLIESHRAGDLYDLIGASRDVVRPALAWNHSRLVVRGTIIEHWLNGELIVREDTASAEWDEMVADSKYAALTAFARPVPGHIILQDHGDRAWYKNIRIREL
jgi:alkaline phosphatase D